MHQIPNRAERYFSLLDQTAKFSNHPQHSMSAVIVIKNKIVGLGFNQMKTHPFQAKFSKNKDSVYIHAEIHAIKNALRSIDVDDLRYADLYVTRVMNGNSKRGMSKPCEGCVGAIVEFGIKRVYYTDSEGKVLKL